MKRVDLHTHSHFSDGRLSPRELVREAKKAGLDVIALTDHENVGGIAEAIEAGAVFGVKVVPGIEFSVADDEGKEQHLLGLFIDYRSQQLSDFLAVWEKTKIQQIHAILKRLHERGFRVELGDVAAQARGYIGRPHIGHAVLGNKENAALLDALGVKTSSDFFLKVLSEDAPESVYVPRQRPLIKEVIGLVRGIGGIAVWAHPFWKNQTALQIEQKCRVFQQLGLGAIEVCYSRAFADREKTATLHYVAQVFGLYETAGSDFHSFEMHRFNKLGDFDTFGLELRLPSGV